MADQLFATEDSQETATTQGAVDATTTTSADTTGSTSQAESWLNNLSDDLKGNDTLSRFNDVNDLANAYVSARSMIGKKNGVPDFENDSPEVIAAFKEQLGAPKDASGYEFTLPEGFEKNEGFEAFTGLLSRGHVNNAIGDQLFQMHEQGVKQAVDAKEEAIKTQKSAEVDVAKAEFAKDPRYNEILINAKNTLQQIDPNGEAMSLKDVNDLGIGTVKVAKFLDLLSSKIGGDKTIKSDVVNPTAGGSMDERISAVRKEVDNKLLTPAAGTAKIDGIIAQYQ